MATPSNNSMGSRLGKIKKLQSQLKTYPDYTPVKPDLTVAAIGALIESVEVQNADVATKLEIYTNAVNIRQKAFLKDKDSLVETVSSIVAVVKSNFGRGSKEAKVIQAMSHKLKGRNFKKKKPPTGGVESPATPPAAGTTAPDAKSISGNERTFGNMMKVYDDIVATLQSYGDRYTVTGDFSIAALKNKSVALNNMNDLAAQASVQLQVARDTRLKGYVQLKSIFDRVKDGVKGQYGARSPQFAAVDSIR